MAHDLRIFDSGVDAIRARPALFLGDPEPGVSLRARLVEFALSIVSTDRPAPTAVRLIQWRDSALTVAFDGEPLPIAPFAPAADAISHPELYRFFLTMGGHPTHPVLAEGGHALSALTKELSVSTVHAGERYRASFSRGLLVTLLAKRPCTAPLGTNWLTFLPDATVISGEMTVEAAKACVERARAAAPSVEFAFQDRTAESAPW